MWTDPRVLFRMSAQLTVLAGPARSGKTAWLLARYRQVLAENRGATGIGSCLWIAPTRHAADEIRARLLAEQLRGCFSPAVYTFEQFVQALLAQSGPGPRFLGRTLKRQLVKRLIAEAVADGRLNYFAPIAQTRGLLDLICGFISDMKRQAVASQRFAGLAASQASEKSRELADIYSRYEQLLDERQLFDADEQFLLASKALKDLPAEGCGLFINLRLIVVDGFSDFTAAQHRILQQLSEKAALEHLMISLPLETGCERA